MRITGITDIVVPIKSSIRNAYIDFSTMTASVVAIQTDMVKDGKPVVRESGARNESGLAKLVQRAA